MEVIFQEILAIEENDPKTALKRYNKLEKDLHVSKPALIMIAVTCPLLAAILTYFLIRRVDPVYKGWIGLLILGILGYAPIFIAYQRLLYDLKYPSNKVDWGTILKRTPIYVFMIIFNNLLLISAVIIISAILASPFMWLASKILNLGFEFDQWPRSVYWSIMGPIIVIVFLWYTSDVPILITIFEIISPPNVLQGVSTGVRWHYRIHLIRRSIREVAAGVWLNRGMIMEFLGVLLMGFLFVTAGPLQLYLELYYENLFEGLIAFGVAGWLLGTGMSRNLIDPFLRDLVHLGLARCLIRLGKLGEAAETSRRIIHYASQTNRITCDLACAVVELTKTLDVGYPAVIREASLRDAKACVESDDQKVLVDHQDIWQLNLEETRRLIEWAGIRV